jgi:hypothetical protein
VVVVVVVVEGEKWACVEMGGSHMLKRVLSTSARRRGPAAVRWGSICLFSGLVGLCVFLFLFWERMDGLAHDVDRGWGGLQRGNKG